MGITFSNAISRANEIDGLGKKAEPVLQFAKFLHECEIFAAENSVFELIKKILHDTDYFSAIVDGTTEGDEREANLKELLAKARAFENESEDTSLAKFLEDVALVADVDNYDEHADAAALMTLHSAKGLEFNTVIIVGVEENLFPSYRSIESGKPEQMEEERRLCYVGFTRAKKMLFLTHAFSRMNYGGVTRNKVSRFLDDIPSECFWGKSFSKPSVGLPPQLAAIAKPAEKPPRIFSSKAAPPSFSVGDNVKQVRYGVGKVLAIVPAGADYEVTVQFASAGQKKFMSSLARLEKIESVK
jgi:DNA helicase-2/ATP-dependent DNA helicase PcrA